MEPNIFQLTRGRETIKCNRKAHTRTLKVDGKLAQVPCVWLQKGSADLGQQLRPPLPGPTAGLSPSAPSVELQAQCWDVLLISAECCSSSACASGTAWWSDTPGTGNSAGAPLCREGWERVNLHPLQSQMGWEGEKKHRTERLRSV